MKIIVGLGNPGQEYSGSRHNVGFLIVDTMVQSETWSGNKSLHAQSTKIGDYIYVKPTTYMNNSGHCVAAVAAYYKVSAGDIWVIHDDLDLPLGKVQIRFGGGTAGHHGLESIVEHLKTDDFGRIRVGIRGDELRQQHVEAGIDANRFVMDKFTVQEMTTLGRVVEAVVAEFT